ncbi:unnamed protein product [Soboliphyme baturini]|uniref:CUE domain-containing protein n=1 Tax=Soboliphyme baturini TaxID=241478 RepID=A0A183IF77_9BILA|nr:unnamed protein product [Soboliphyme baturini]
MGKSENVSTSAKLQAPTSEQLRIAQLLNDPKGTTDPAVMREKVLKVIELTRCTESEALGALHDCDNDVEKAVDQLLEGDRQGEWIVKEGRKSRKSHYTIQENHERTGSPTLEDHRRQNEVIEIGQGRFSGNRRARGTARTFSQGPPPRFRGRGSGCKEINAWDYKTSKGAVDVRDIDEWKDSSTWDNSMAANAINVNRAGSGSILNSKIDEWSPDDWGEGDDEWVRGPRVFTASNMESKALTMVGQDTCLSDLVHSLEASSKATGNGQFCSESIDVNLLFTQKSDDSTSHVSCVPVVSEGDWSKHAADTIKSELGIGKAFAEPLDTASRMLSHESFLRYHKGIVGKIECPLDRTRLDARAASFDVAFLMMYFQAKPKNLNLEVHCCATLSI